MPYAVTRLVDDAAPQPPAHAALPVPDRDAGRHAGRLPAAVRLRLRRHARRRPRRRRPAAGPSTSTTSCPGILHDDHRQRRPGHRDLGRHGHDRRHHRPLPDHGHLPAPRCSTGHVARQHAPDRCSSIVVVIGVGAGSSGSGPRAGLARVARRGRAARAGRLRADLVSRRAWAWSAQDASRRPATSPMPLHPAAVPGQRVRPDRLDAGWLQLVRRIPAVHARSSRPCGDC